MGYTVEDHTADIRLRVTAPSLSALFQSAVQGLAVVLAGEDVLDRDRTITEPVTLTAPDETALLVDLLNELLRLSDTNEVVYPDITVEALTDRRVDATAHGVSSVEREEDVKAVTYHGAVIEQTDGTYTVTLTFDI